MDSAINYLQNTSAAYKNRVKNVLAEIAREAALLPDFLSACAAFITVNSSSDAEARQKIGMLDSAMRRINKVKDFPYFNDKCAMLWLRDLGLENQYRDLLRLLWPQDIMGKSKIRVGGPGDGGYVMVEPGKPGIALSLGIGPNTPWDLEMADLGWKILQFDGTIENPPVAHPNMRFFRKNVTWQSAHGDGEISMAEILAMTGDEENLILQMDIEGAEWPILENLPEADLARFSQITGEFHHLDEKVYLPAFKKAFQKLCKTHVPIHLHYNSVGNTIGFSNFLVSQLWEISFVRRDSAPCSPSGDIYPTPLDFPNIPNLPDLYIGSFEVLCGREESACGQNAPGGDGELAPGSEGAVFTPPLPPPQNPE